MIEQKETKIKELKEGGRLLVSRVKELQGKLKTIQKTNDDYEAVK